MATKSGYCEGPAARQSTGWANTKDIPNGSRADSAPHSEAAEGTSAGPRARVQGKDKSGSEQAGSGGDAFGYLKTQGPNFAYLGHFRQEKFLEEGHNTAKKPKLADDSGYKPPVPTISTPLPPPGTPASNVSRRGARKAAYDFEHPVRAAQSAGRTAVKSAKLGVKLARATGGDVSAARAAVSGAKQARRSSVTAAIANPESARSERAVRVATRTTARKAATATRLRKRINKLGGSY